MDRNSVPTSFQDADQEDLLSAGLGELPPYSEAAVQRCGAWPGVRAATRDPGLGALLPQL